MISKGVFFQNCLAGTTVGGEPWGRSPLLAGAFAWTPCRGGRGQSSPQLPRDVCAGSWLLVLPVTEVSLWAIITATSNTLGPLHHFH